MSNAGAVASIVGAGTALYSATQTPDSMGSEQQAVQLDKTTVDEAAELDAVNIGDDTEAGKAKSAKTRFKVEREPSTTGVNTNGTGTTGVQI